MRRLGWVDSIPKGDKPILEVAMEAHSYDYPVLFQTPAPAPPHPAYEADRKGKSIDRAALPGSLFLTRSGFSRTS
jgi:hypothetical protein